MTGTNEERAPMNRASYSPNPAYARRSPFWRRNAVGAEPERVTETVDGKKVEFFDRRKIIELGNKRAILSQVRGTDDLWLLTAYEIR